MVSNRTTIALLEARVDLTGSRFDFWIWRFETREAEFGDRDLGLLLFWFDPVFLLRVSRWARGLSNPEPILAVEVGIWA